MTQKTASPVREILCATDFSAPSEAAVRAAHDYARHFGARLHLLHVVGPHMDPDQRPLLTSEAERLGVAAPVVAAVESGMPAAQIVRYAERNGIDLIIVGTHGRTGVSRVLLGSVAERVVRTAPCPVLTVPLGRGSAPPRGAPEPIASKARRRI